MKKTQLRPELVSMPWHHTARLALASHRILVLIGDPGSGKTEFVQQQCRAATAEPAEELQGGPKVDDLSFFGRYTLVGDTTPFVDGPLWRALRRGSWFVLNDADRNHAQVRGRRPRWRPVAHLDPVGMVPVDADHRRL